jgi:hypothetical protein
MGPQVSGLSVGLQPTLTVFPSERVAWVGMPFVDFGSCNGIWGFTVISQSVNRSSYSFGLRCSIFSTTQTSLRQRETYRFQHSANPHKC